MHQDPIADMLTRIRNANALHHETVSIPSSKLKVNIIKILLSEGFITSYKEVKTKEGHKNIEVTLKYGPNGEKVISGLKRFQNQVLELQLIANTSHLF